MQKVLSHLGISKEESLKDFVFELNPNCAQAVKKGVSGTKHPFKTPCSIYEALTKFVDLKGAISKKTLKVFSEFCSSSEEKEQMLKIHSSKDLFEKEISSQFTGLLGLF